MVYKQDGSARQASATLRDKRGHCSTEPELNDPVKNPGLIMNGKLVAVLALFLISAAMSQGKEIPPEIPVAVVLSRHLSRSLSLWRGSVIFVSAN